MYGPVAAVSATSAVTGGVGAAIATVRADAVTAAAPTIVIFEEERPTVRHLPVIFDQSLQAPESPYYYGRDNYQDRQLGAAYPMMRVPKHVLHKKVLEAAEEHLKSQRGQE
ncbi:hypothetical protein MMOR_22000 [Mycolicibacterium moriokaense]|uniref:Uncharacterized protein n=1 Tax=Mycolicibacterium moriokaense TaxID=39691 RepID=A0AAD1M6C7_9MYCO|nr:hypothetical protein MMOR_22000 [Mycolicibacterium moriokaense]